MLLRLLSVVVVVGVSLIILREPTQACECEEIDGPWTVTDELERSELVFRGFVTSIEARPGGSTFHIRFSVVTVWKGEVAKDLIIWTRNPSDQCGYRFSKGVEYVVFVHERGLVSSCSLSAPVAEAEEEIETLGVGFAPEANDDLPVSYVPEEPQAPAPPTDKTWIYVGGGFAVWAGLLGVIWLSQRRRRLSRIIRTARDH